MGISNAMNNAASGLRANSRLIDTISNNVANELTPGYARRVTELSSATINGYGSGVVALATTRVEDALLTSERRVGDASAAAATVKSNAYSGILATIGEPGKTGAVATLVTDLETALMGPRPRRRARRAYRTWPVPPRRWRTGSTRSRRRTGPPGPRRMPRSPGR